MTPPASRSFPIAPSSIRLVTCLGGPVSRRRQVIQPEVPGHAFQLGDESGLQMRLEQGTKRGRRECGYGNGIPPWLVVFSSYTAREPQLLV